MKDKLKDDNDLNFKEFMELMGLKDRKKLLELIKRICENEEYDLEPGNFKKAGKDKEYYVGDENTYQFNKEWKDIAYVLFSMYEKSPFYRKNRTLKGKDLTEMVEYNKYCMELVKEELSDYSRRRIESHPVFLATFFETEIMEHLSKQMSYTFEIVSKMPIESRICFFEKLNSSMNISLIETQIEKTSIKKEFEEMNTGVYEGLIHGDYEHRGLDKYLASFLKKEMDESHRKKYEEYTKKYKEARDEIDENYKKISGDTEEEVKFINKVYNKHVTPIINGEDITDYQSKEIEELVKFIGERIERKEIEKTDMGELDSLMYRAYKEGRLGECIKNFLKKETEETLIKISENKEEETKFFNRIYDNDDEVILNDKKIIDYELERIAGIVKIRAKKINERSNLKNLIKTMKMDILYSEIEEERIEDTEISNTDSEDYEAKDIEDLHNICKKARIKDFEFGLIKFNTISEDDTKRDYLDEAIKLKARKKGKGYLLEMLKALNELDELENMAGEYEDKEKFKTSIDDVINAIYR